MTRELAHRENDGLEVRLIWVQPTDEVLLSVLDTRHAQLHEAFVPPARALDAFQHPFAYLPEPTFQEPVAA
jgi:hypothetical protein